MKIRSGACLILFCFFNLFSMSAQENPAPSDSAFAAPYVTRLRVEDLLDGRIFLHWIDSLDLGEGAKYEVWRHSEEITAETLRLAKLVGTVAQGTQQTYDIPEAPGTYFYWVAGIDSAGQRRDIFLPFRNKSVTGLAYNPDETVPTRITDLKAAVERETIVLTFQSSRPNRELVIYRLSQPGYTLEDLEQGVRVATIPGTQSSALDLPPAGLPYYYTVVDKKGYEQARAGLISEANATRTPVTLPLTPAPPAAPSAPSSASDGPAPARPAAVLPPSLAPSPVTVPPLPSMTQLAAEESAQIRRPLPLPRLVVAQTPDWLDRPVQGPQISPAAQAVLDKIPSYSIPVLPWPEPALQGADLRNSSRFFQELGPLFAAKNWAEARALLMRWHIRQPPGITLARATYYLALVNGQLGDFRSAVLHLTESRDEETLNEDSRKLLNLAIARLP